MLSLFLAGLFIVSAMAVFFVLRKSGVRFLALALGFGMALIVLFNASTVRVAPTDAAVAISYTQQTTSLGKGLHWKLPTTRVITIDGTSQESTLPGEARVYIGDGTESTVSVLLEWRVNKENSGSTFEQYRGKDDILQALRTLRVETSLTTATNAVLGAWDPVESATKALDDADGNKNEDVSTSALITRDYAAQADQIREVLEDLVEKDGNLIIVEKLTITNIDFSKDTQERINALVAETAKQRVAERSVATAEAEARRNREASSALTDEILRKQCLDTIAEAVEKGVAGVLPGGFSCYGGSNAVVTTK